MVKKKTVKRKVKVPAETDGAYFLKIVLYLIIGAQWVYLVNPDQSRQIPLPIGLAIGALFAAHDHFQLDRKIEFAILAIACFIGYWAQTGLLVSVLN